MKHFFTVLLVLLAITSYGQITRGGAGAMVIGTQLIPTDELQKFHPGAPDLSNANISVGGYGYWQFSRLVAGFKGSGFYSTEKTDATYSYKLGGGMFAIDLGYKIVNTPKWSIYPLVGIGAGSMSYNIAETQDIVLTPGETPDLYQANYDYNSVVFDLGVRVEKSLGYEEGDCGKGGGMVGLEFGYLFTPSSNKWKTSSGGDIINAPDYSMNGFYIRLLIGGFGGI